MHARSMLFVPTVCIWKKSSEFSEILTLYGKVKSFESNKLSLRDMCGFSVDTDCSLERQAYDECARAQRC